MLAVAAYLVLMTLLSTIVLCGAIEMWRSGDRPTAVGYGLSMGTVTLVLGANPPF